MDPSVQDTAREEIMQNDIILPWHRLFEDETSLLFKISVDKSVFVI